jgi:hypothetical protein
MHTYIHMHVRTYVQDLGVGVAYVLRVGICWGHGGTLMLCVHCQGLEGGKEVSERLSEEKEEGREGEENGKE